MSEQKENPKEAYVGQKDRPEVQLSPDTPIANLRVRDLAALLGTSLKVSDHFPPKPIIGDHKLFIADSHKPILDTKFILKDVHDSIWQKEIKDVRDSVNTIPQGIGPEGSGVSAIDSLVKQVAQLQQDVDKLKR